MNVKVAEFLIRCQMAMVEEGIGPRDDLPEDVEILAEAVKVAGHLFNEHELWDVGLVASADHIANTCANTYCRDYRN